MRASSSKPSAKGKRALVAYRLSPPTLRHTFSFLMIRDWPAVWACCRAWSQADISEPLLRLALTQHFDDFDKPSLQSTHIDDG